MGVVVECALAGFDQLREGPIRDERDQSLWWVDIRAWALHHWTPGASAATTIALPEEVGAIPLPVAIPTCCGFGAAELNTHCINSARQRSTPEQLADQPLAGSLLAVRPGGGGLPESRCAG